MRRRKVRYTQPDAERPTLLLMAAGAIAGAAAGLYLGRRYRTLDAFLDDVRDRVGTLRDAWTEADEIEEEHREALRGATLADDEEAEPDDEDDALDDDDEEELDTTDEYEAGGLEGWVDEADEEDVDDDEDLDDEDADDDLASVTTSNGATGRQRTAERVARHLEGIVLDALRADRRLRARAIEIAAVGEGVVELTGSVHTIDEISRAAAIVRKVPGVNMVLNRIEVRMGGHVETASVPREPVGTEPPADPPA